MKVQQLIMKVRELIMNTSPKNEGAIADNEHIKSESTGINRQTARHSFELSLLKIQKN